MSMLFKTLMLALVAATIMGAAAPPQMTTDAQKKCYLIQWPSGRLEWICVDAAVMPLVLEAAPKPPPPCLIYCDPEGRCKLEC